MIRAVAYVPPGPLNDKYVNNCFTHMAHRGYEVAGLVRGNLQAAFGMLASGSANVIVFASQEHQTEEWAPRVEFCGEDTIALGEDQPPRPRPRNDGPERRPRRIE